MRITVWIPPWLSRCVSISKENTGAVSAHLTGSVNSLELNTDSSIPRSMRTLFAIETISAWDRCAFLVSPLSHWMALLKRIDGSTSSSFSISLMILLTKEISTNFPN